MTKQRTATLFFIVAIISFQNTAIAGGNVEKEKNLLKQLYEISAKLTELTGRPFTPDGHVVGSAGEVLAAYHYGLTLETASNEGFDGKTIDGVKVEIKTTGGKRGVSFNWKDEIVADKLLILKLSHDQKDGFRLIYNGDAQPVFEILKNKKIQKNGQRSLSLNQLSKLQKDGEGLKRMR